MSAHNKQLGYGDYLRFRDLVLERSGLYFPEKKRGDLEFGVLKALEASPTACTVTQYFYLLSNKNDATGQAELRRLINTLTIGETHFFRDEPQFDALATQVLPSLIERKRAAAQSVGPHIKPQLRLWSAGCASGEEPYSLAMLLSDLIPDIDNWYVLILATDINGELLKRAEQGLYSNWSFREKRALALRERYFTPHDKRYQLDAKIRQMVTFTTLNLIEDEYPAIHNNTLGLDLIMCRNVTIYFAVETTQMVTNRFHSALVEGGWLVVGHAEPSLLIYEQFEARNFPGTIVYQKTAPPPIWDVPAPDPPQPVLRKPRSNSRPVPQVAPPPADPLVEAQQLLTQGRSTEAITLLNDVVTLRPNWAEAQQLLGHAHANLGQWEAARSHCETALRLDDLQPHAYYVLSLVSQHEGDHQTALDYLKKAVYLDRQQPLYHFAMALLYQKLNQGLAYQRALNSTIKILHTWTPTTLLPDTDGTTAAQLLEVCQTLLADARR